MITIHQANATTVTGSGLGVLDNQIINPQVSEELNASFTLSFDYPAWGEHAGQLTLGAIVACPAPWTDTKQAFRITAIDTSLNQVLRVEAVHVFFDLAHNLIADTFAANKTPAAALAQLLGAANYPHSFTATSADTGTVASARIVRTSIAAALLDTEADNSFLSRCGGEFVFDNWHIHHAPRRGSLTGIVIQDRKNLTGYQSSIDTAALATRILPVGYDGLLLPELYVDSPRIDDYPFPHVRVFKYEAVKAIKDPAKPGKDELPLKQAYERLRELAKAEFASGVDVPTSSYEVSFVDLSQTVEYTEFAELEQVDLGDTVTVKHTDLGVNLHARVTAYTYNPLTRSYNQIMLGSVRPSFTTVAKTIQGFSEAVANANETAATALASADGKNTNYYSPAKPAHPRLGDTWFRDEGESGVSIWTYAITDSGEPGWIPLTGAINMALLNQTLADTATEIAEAKTRAEDAIAAGRDAATRIDALAGELESTASDVAGAQAQVNQLRGDLAGLDMAASQYATDISGLKTDLAATTDALALAQSDLDSLDAELQETRDHVTATNATATNAKNRADTLALLAGMLEPGNLVWNPRFRENALGWGVPSLARRTSVSSTGGYKNGFIRYRWTGFENSYKVNIYNGYNVSERMIPTSVGRSYKISIRLRCTQELPAGALTIRMWNGTTTLSPTITSGTWIEWETTSTITSDSSYQSFTWLVIASTQTMPLNVDVDLCEPYVVEAATEWLIVDGAVKASKLAADSVDATKIQAGAITTAKLAASAVNATKIKTASITAHLLAANSVTATQVAAGAITTVKLAAGAITGEKIAAETITAQHLVVTAGNLFPDPHFLDECWGNFRHSGYGRTGIRLVADGYLHAAYYLPAGYTNRPMTVEPGAAYRLSCWARFGGTAGIPYVEVYARYIDTNGTLRVAPVGHIPRTEAVSYKEGHTEVTFTMPADMKTGECTLGFRVGASMPDGDVIIADLTLVRAADASLIVDGAITARAIKAGSITGDRLTAGTITGTQIKAGSITSDKLVIASGFITTAMIKDAAITSAKISAVDAGKITTGTLSAARIGTGSITSDKLTIANGFIKTAMIANLAVTSAKIASLDASKITTGYLNAARIKAGTITADKLASNAIQVGLAGWTSSIRITPTQIGWYDGSTLQGTITSEGMKFWHGDRFIGVIGENYKTGNTSIRGIVMNLSGQGEYITWGYRTSSSGNYTSMLTLDPKGSFNGTKGIHLGADLRTRGYTFYTAANRGVILQDAHLTNVGTYPGWAGTNNYTKVVFATSHLYVVTNNVYYNMTNVMNRIKELISRVNTLISLLNKGWVTSISGSGSNISWNYYSNTGYSTMSTTL